MRTVRQVIPLVSLVCEKNKLRHPISPHPDFRKPSGSCLLIILKLLLSKAFLLLELVKIPAFVCVKLLTVMLMRNPA